MSCALLARGSFEMESGFCVHLSRSFRESALSWAGECSLALLFFFFSAELRPPVAPDCHVKSCLAARAPQFTSVCLINSQASVLRFNIPAPACDLVIASSVNEKRHLRLRLFHLQLINPSVAKITRDCSARMLGVACMLQHG